MLSISNAPDIGDRILDAAASCAVDFGADRVTVAEIARRAGVSRPTVYRRWPDTQSILADVLTARVIGAWRDVPDSGRSRTALVDRIVAIAHRLRHDDVVVSVLRSDPDLAMTYIAERMGTSQQVLLDVLAEELRAAQRSGEVRAGDPRRLAAMVLLITQSTIQSAQMVQPILNERALAGELAYSLNGYLS